MANYTVAWTVPQTGRSVSYGLSTDTKLTTEPAGSTAYETDTDKYYTYDGAGWVQTGTSMARHVHLATLISGEDQTNDVIRIESQQGYYVFDHGAATADETLGTTGAAGDLLVRVTVTESGTSQPINIYDGTVAAGTLVLSIPASAAIGTTYELGIVATTSAGWTADDLADTTGIVVCVGRFT